MRPRAQTAVTAVTQAQTSETKHLEDSPEALGFKGSFKSWTKKQDALPQHLTAPFMSQQPVMTVRGSCKYKSKKP